MLSKEDRIQRDEKIPWRLIDGEAVLVNMEDGEVIHLNEVAAEIWNVIDGTRSVHDIIDHVNNEFEAERATIEKDVFDFLNRLIEKKVARTL
jgi:coenzyme PQQ biosynthesis protein PqqD